jgi:hypothetical protein
MNNLRRFHDYKVITASSEEDLEAEVKKLASEDWSLGDFRVVVHPGVPDHYDYRVRYASLVLVQTLYR